jgi:hypothetical protein
VPCRKARVDEAESPPVRGKDVEKLPPGASRPEPPVNCADARIDRTPIWPPWERSRRLAAASPNLSSGIWKRASRARVCVPLGGCVRAFAVCVRRVRSPCVVGRV